MLIWTFEKYEKPLHSNAEGTWNLDEAFKREFQLNTVKYGVRLINVDASAVDVENDEEGEIEHEAQFNSGHWKAKYN